MEFYADVRNSDDSQSRRMHYIGEGVPQNKAKAAEHYMLAAEQGEPKGRALWLLGEMHLTGDGVPADVAKALSWYATNSPHPLWVWSARKP